MSLNRFLVARGRGLLFAAGLLAGLHPAGASAQTAWPVFGPPANPFGVWSLPAQASYQPLIGSVRTVESLDWPAVQPSPGRFTWAGTDNIIDHFADAGVEPMLKLLTCGLTEDGEHFWAVVPVPSSAIPPPGACASNPAKVPADLSTFISRVVARYEGTVRYFAIENEVNAANQWVGKPGRQQCIINDTTGAADCPVFDDYLTLLRRAHTAAHEANPNVVILESGLGSRVYGIAIARDLYEQGGRTSAVLDQAVNFYNSYYKSRYSSPQAADVFYINPLPASTLKSRFEAHVFAPYDPADPEPVSTGDRFYYFAKHMFDDRNAYDAFQLHFYDNWDMMDDVVNWIHQQMDQHWGPGHRKPILCWECGTYWPVVDREFYNFDVDRYSARLSKRFVVGLGMGLEQIVHLPLFGGPPKSTDLFQSAPLLCSSGADYEPQLCNGSNNQNLASVPGKAFRAISSRLASFLSVQPVTIFGPRVQGFRFQKSSGAIVALWSRSGTQHIDLTTLGTVTSVTDQYGASVTSSLSDFALDFRVVYVRVT